MDVNAQRWRRFLETILNGKRDVRNLTYDEEDRLQCMARFCRKESGSTAARQALLTDLSSSALNGHAAQLILSPMEEYFANYWQPIWKPALLWEAYKTAAVNHKSTEDGIHDFESFINELLFILSPSSDFASQLDIKITAQGLIDRSSCRDLNLHMYVE
ncbi:hypothetical protein LTR56_023568 [Elasticomyces elasticus]|nr:hypothetical protein LTR56_023568 [Elasticomyces elasticus]KAK3624236.1 hypothetical protein LTR22_024064 [Elasticomyces elasticus]KAK4906082.1 hypothetical protein LTR49_024710 [Elasticomyces elasticus]KAK5744114.1 hypothetical protein LTS12_023590 [Elasticomyces elasticus]